MPNILYILCVFLVFYIPLYFYAFVLDFLDLISSLFFFISIFMVIKHFGNIYAL